MATGDLQTGYIVLTGGNGVTPGDSIGVLQAGGLLETGFTEAANLGEGQTDSILNLLPPQPGTFYLATNGSTYFVPENEGVLTGLGVLPTVSPTGLAVTNNSVIGTTAGDTLTGTEAGDLIYGGPGGASGDDSLSGAGGDDVVFGRDGVDTLSGGGASDTLFGGGGSDALFGGDAADTLYGDPGDDTLQGGAGGDLINGGAGIDTADYSESAAGVEINLGAGTVTGSAATGDTLLGIEIIAGSGFGDTLTGGESSDTLFGGAGGDVITGAGGTDVLYGDGGADTLTSGGGDDSLFGGDGGDRFVLVNTFGNDTLFGGEGGEGTAFDILDTTSETVDITVTFTGSEGGTLTAGPNTGQFTDIEQVLTGFGNDLIDGTGATTPINISTDSGQDTILASSGGDLIVAGAGNDSVTGGAGADTVDGGAGADTITGGASEDSLVGGAGDDSIDGGADDDDVEGGLGDDTLAGGAGADTLTGGEDEDTLIFGRGDVANGGAGADIFTFDDTVGGDGDIIVTGGAGTEPASGDILDLGTLTGYETEIVSTNPLTGALSGRVTLGDGTVITFSGIDQIICFTPGTMIRTLGGARAIETLGVGDMVLTRDSGMQPIRWIGRSTVAGLDRFAPIRLRKGAVPDLSADLLVSPQHRMLVEGYRAELLFGEREVLAPARHMVDGKFVTVEEMAEVTYIHMLFDRHEVVYANGAATESYHPASYGLDGICEAAREELFAIFPELRSMPEAYGDTARRVLKGYEVHALAW